MERWVRCGGCGEVGEVWRRWVGLAGPLPVDSGEGNCRVPPPTWRVTYLNIWGAFQKYVSTDFLCLGKGRPCIGNTRLQAWLSFFGLVEFCMIWLNTFGLVEFVRSSPPARTGLQEFFGQDTGVTHKDLRSTNLRKKIIYESTIYFFKHSVRGELEAAITLPGGNPA